MSVQFYGIDPVVKAYENNKVAAWGLFCGRQLLVKYTGDDPGEGAELLRNFLTDIDLSNATYTLKVFDAAKDLKIKEKSEADASFNFKVVKADVYEERDRVRGGYSNALADELKQLKKEFDEYKAGDLGDDEDQSLIGRIGNILLTEPAKVPQMIDSLKAVFAMFQGQPAPQHLSNTYPGFAGPTIVPAPVVLPGAINGIGDDALINSAVSRLRRCDPDIAKHLEKLARIAESDPAGFKQLLTYLDAITV